MSKSRQRAKQRQQERRAARLGGSQVEARAEPAEPLPDDDLERAADLAVGAPPEELGRSDETLEHLGDGGDEGDEPPEPPSRRTSRYDDDEEPAEEPDGRPRTHDEHHDRGKVLQFLVNVWAELQRVQWPNRQQLLSLTGVVLGFVLIAGGYLGLLDAIFSRIIDRII